MAIAISRNCGEVRPLLLGTNCGLSVCKLITASRAKDQKNEAKKLRRGPLDETDMDITSSAIYETASALCTWAMEGRPTTPVFAALKQKLTEAVVVYA